MTRAENWNLILRLCELAKDDDITSVRVALLNDFSIPEPFQPANHFRHLLGALKPFVSRDLTSRSTGRPKKTLPLILFPYASGSNLPHLAPVAREARNRGLLGLIVAGERLRPEHLEGFDNVVSEIALWRTARKRGLAGIFQSARKKFKRIVAILEQLDPPSARRARQNYGWIFRNLVVSHAMSESFRTLLEEWEPSCVISTSDYWPFEFQLFSQARRLGIPNAMIQHGELNDVISWPTYAETFLVWGSVFQEKLLKLGAPAERLRVCGMPSADVLFNRTQNLLSKAANSSPPVCLLFSHAHERREEPILFKAFATFLKQVIELMPRVRWIIRLHPGEDESFYHEIGIVGHPQVQIQPRNISLEDAVAEADVTCTIRSTAGLQAMILQRPLVIIDIVPNTECAVWWPLNGGGLAAKTPKDFEVHCSRLTGNSEFRASTLNSQREFIDRAFANKGRATSSVVDYLAEQTRFSSTSRVPVPVKLVKELQQERIQL